MKHTDFYHLHKTLDSLAEQELVEALQCVGGKITFSRPDDDEDDTAPILAGYLRYHDDCQDIRISSVELDENGNPAIFGASPDGYNRDTLVEMLLPGQLEYIIDEIDAPGTTTDPERCRETLAKITDLLTLK